MILIGTSGYNYPEWKGNFYPSTLSTSKMLPYYADRFSTVEINYTFYRFPTEKALQEWGKVTPEDFSFTLKAPRRITHDARLRDCEDLVRAFCERTRTLGSKLGVVLFQLPPSFRVDLDALQSLLDWVPEDLRIAMEFRHDSWYSEEVYQRLSSRNVALCVNDNEKGTTPLVATADFGYFRLRDEGYQDEDIAKWGRTVLEQGTRWKDAFVYFKHEEQGLGPQFAQALSRVLAPPAGSP